MRNSLAEEGTISKSRWAGIASALCVSVGVGLVGASDRLARLVAAPPATPGVAPAEPSIGLPSGNPVVRRNSAVTVAALVPPHLAPAELLVRRGAESATLPMSERAPGEWAGTIPGHWTASDCEYAVRAGPGRAACTGWAGVRAADPGELAALSVAPAGAVTSPSEWRAVAGTALSFRAQASGPVGRCEVRLTLPGGATQVTALAPDTSGTGGGTWAGQVVAPEVADEAALPLAVVLVTQHGYEAEFAGRLTVAPDRPPEVVALAGVLPNPIRLRPGAALALELAARDDVAVTAVTAEWTRPGSGSPAASPVGGLGLPAPEFRAALTLVPPLPAAGPWLLRLTLCDRLGARTPVPRGGPLSVEIDPAAPPLATQQREAESRLIAETLAELRAEVAPLRADSPGAADRLAAQARNLAAADARLSSDPALAAVRPGPLAARALQARGAILTGDTPGAVAGLGAYRDDLARRESRQESVAAGRLALERLAGIAALPGGERRAALESLAASDPFLIRAKSAEAAAPLAESARAAREFGGGLAEWTAARDRLAAYQSRRAAAGCAAPLAEWSATLGAAHDAATPAAARSGLAAPDARRAGRAASLAAGNLLETLVEVERAGAEAARLAGHFEAQVAARRDRKEAARQLARWRQLVGGPGEELDAWRAAYSCLAGPAHGGVLPPEPPGDPAGLAKLLAQVPSREDDRLRALAEVRRRAAARDAPPDQRDWSWLAGLEPPGAAVQAARLDSARLALAESAEADRPARRRHLAKCFRALEDALAGQTPAAERIAELAADAGRVPDPPSPERRRLLRAWRAELLALPTGAPLTKSHAAECLERGAPAGAALSQLASVELGAETSLGHARWVLGLLAARPAGADFAAAGRLAADELDATLAEPAPAERAAALAALRAGNRAAALSALAAWLSALERTGGVAPDPVSGPPAPSAEERRADWPATRFQPSDQSAELLRAAARQSERLRDQLAAAVVEARPTSIETLGDPHAARAAAWLDFAGRFPASPLAAPARALGDAYRAADVVGTADASASAAEALRLALADPAAAEATTLLGREAGPDHPAFAANRAANLERDWRRAAATAGADFAARLAPLAGAATGVARARLADLGAAWRELASGAGKLGGGAELADLAKRIETLSAESSSAAGYEGGLAAVGARLKVALADPSELTGLAGELRSVLGQQGAPAP